MYISKANLPPPRAPTSPSSHASAGGPAPSGDGVDIGRGFAPEAPPAHLQPHLEEFDQGLNEIIHEKDIPKVSHPVNRHKQNPPKLASAEEIRKQAAEGQLAVGTMNPYNPATEPELWLAHTEVTGVAVGLYNLAHIPGASLNDFHCEDRLKEHNMIDDCGDRAKEIREGVLNLLEHALEEINKRVVQLLEAGTSPEDVAKFIQKAMSPDSIVRAKDIHGDPSKVTDAETGGHAVRWMLSAFFSQDHGYARKDKGANTDRNSSYNTENGLFGLGRSLKPDKLPWGDLDRLGRGGFGAGLDDIIANDDKLMLEANWSTKAHKWDRQMDEMERRILADPNLSIEDSYYLRQQFTSMRLALLDQEAVRAGGS